MRRLFLPPLKSGCEGRPSVTASSGSAFLHKSKKSSAYPRLASLFLLEAAFAASFSLSFTRLCGPARTPNCAITPQG